MNFERKPFGIFFHHGGQFIPDGKFERYEGGVLAAVGGDFDPDKFGYFDLVDELNKLGFQRWKRLTFQKPWSVEQVDIKGDAEVMDMISRLKSVRTQMCKVYVVDGQKGEHEHIVQDKSVGSSVVESMGGGGMKQKVIQSVKKSKVETTVKSNIHSTTKRKRETNVKNEKNKVVEDNLEKTVDKNVEKSVQKSLFQSTQEVVVASRSVSGKQNERSSRSASRSMNERGYRSASGSKNERSASVSKNEKAFSSPSVTKCVFDGASEDMTEGPGEGMGEGATEGLGGAMVDGGGMGEGATEGVVAAMGDGEGFDGSNEEVSYIPSSEDEETDDEMDAEELVSEDEEYIQGRRKLKEKKVFVITDDMFMGLVDGGQKSDYVSEYENSEEDAIYSDSKVYEDETRRTRERHAKVMYDPRCDHKQLVLSVGMGFVDGFQARDAITDNAVENGWEIHFKRANQKQFEAACIKPCEWWCSGSVISKNGIVAIKKIGRCSHMS